MDLKQLGYFVAVAEAGSFSRAAVAVNLAQPTLSRQVGLLEADLGQRLAPQHVDVGPGSAERQRRVVGERAEVAEMVGDALTLEQQRPQPAGTGRDRAPCRRFQRHAIRPCMSDGRIA